MPKIKTISEKFGGKPYSFDLWYNTDKKFFIKGGLPVDVLTVLGNDVITDYYTDLSQLEDNIKIMADEYNKAVHTSRKIIVFSILFGQEFIDEKDLVGTKYTGHIGNRVSGFGFRFHYWMGVQHTVGKEKIIKEMVKANPYSHDLSSDNMVEGHSSLRPKDNEIVIDWTPEREQFFLDLKQNTTSLCEKILKFMGKDEQQIIATIDSGVKLLGETSRKIE